MHQYQISVYKLNKIYKSNKNLFPNNKKYNILCTDLDSKKNYKTRYYINDDINGLGKGSHNHNDLSITFKGNNKFSGNSYTITNKKNVKSKNGNISFSPYDVEACDKKGNIQKASGFIKTFKIKTEKKLKMSDLKFLQDLFDSLSC